MSKRMTTVTLNAAIDKTYFLPQFTLGKTNRASKMIAQPGGKGINSARVIRALGEEVIASGIVAGNNGAFIKQALDKQGIPHQMLEIEGESRLCLNIIDEAAGVYTEILEAGPTVREQDCEALIVLISKLAAESSVVTLSGSLPAGAPADLYGKLIDAVHEQGAVPLLDASGQALVEGLNHQPFMIKPNEDELRGLLQLLPYEEAPATGTSTSTESTAELDETAQITPFIQQIMKQKNLPCAAVTLGEKGAIVGWGDQIYRISPVQIDAVNPVGSGDSFIAGIAVGLHRGMNKIETLKLASACGASNALHQAAGVIDPAEVERLMGEIEVTPIASL